MTPNPRHARRRGFLIGGGLLSLALSALVIAFWLIALAVIGGGE